MPLINTPVVSYLIAFIATMVAVSVLIPVAYKFDFVDKPGGRKHHHLCTPLIGGIAIFFGFYFSLLFLPLSLKFYRALFASSLLLIFVGAVDDAVDVQPKMRLLAQFVAACIAAVWSNNYISHLGNLFGTGSINLDSYGILLTIFLFVTYFNALNMLDGQDGLAGIVSLSQIVFLTYIAYHIGQTNDAHILAIFSTCIIVYLLFNLNIFGHHKTKIFLGDAGSTFIALVILFFAVKLSQTPANTIKPITFVWLLAYPIYDLVGVAFYRIRQGRSPLSAGRDHMHHLIEKLGCNNHVSVLMICAFSVILEILGLIFNKTLTTPLSLLLYIFLLLVYVTISYKARVKVNSNE